MTIAAGVIGLGAMGEPISALLLKAGFDVAVYDVRSEPVERLAKLGARACGSAGEIARESDIVISLVSDASQTMDVVFGTSGVLEEIRSDTIFAIGSTLGPAP